MWVFGAFFVALGGFFLWVEIGNGGMLAGKGPSAVGWVIGPAFIAMGLGAWFLAGKRLRAQVADATLLANGTRGTLHVSAYTFKELAPSGEHLYAIDAELRADGFPPHPVRRDLLVPKNRTDGLRPGAAFHVRVDPTSPSRFVVDWARGVI